MNEIVSQRNIGDAEVAHVTEIDLVIEIGHTKEVGHVIVNQQEAAHVHVRGHL